MLKAIKAVKARKVPNFSNACVNVIGIDPSFQSYVRSVNIIRCAYCLLRVPSPRSACLLVILMKNRNFSVVKIFYMRLRKHSSFLLHATVSPMPLFDRERVIKYVTEFFNPPNSMRRR